MRFEKYLDSFKGKPERQVLIDFGNPDQYLNTEATDNKQMGTYMIYNWKFGTRLKCSIRFKLEEKRNIVLEWDYQGNGCY